MIEHCDEAMNTKRKCELLNVARSSMYYKPKNVKNNDAVLLNEIRDIHLQFPFFGRRRVHIELRKRGYDVNHKVVQRLRKEAGIEAIYPRKKTTIRNPQHTFIPTCYETLL